MAAHAPAHLVQGVEEGLLVLLQVPVVGERQALQGGQQAGQVADQPAGPAPGQLGDVGVLLLGEHRAAGGVGVGQARRSRTPRSTTARSPPRAGTGARRSGPGRTGPRPRSPGRTRRRGSSRTGPAKPSSAATRSGSSGSDEPASAPAPSGETSSRRRVLEQPVDVPGQRPAVGQQMVGQQHRLGPLQVGVARQVDVLCGLGPAPAGPPAGRGHAGPRPAAPAW